MGLAAPPQESHPYFGPLASGCCPSDLATSSRILPHFRRHGLWPPEHLKLPLLSLATLLNQSRKMRPPVVRERRCWRRQSLFHQLDRRWRWKVELTYSEPCHEFLWWYFTVSVSFSSEQPFTTCFGGRVDCRSQLGASVKSVFSMLCWREPAIVGFRDRNCSWVY